MYTYVYSSLEQPVVIMREAFLGRWSFGLKARGEGGWDFCIIGASLLGYFFSMDQLPLG